MEDVNLLRETVTVRLDRGGEADLIVYKVEDITFVKPVSNKEACGGKCAQQGKCPARQTQNAARSAKIEEAPDAEITE